MSLEFQHGLPALVGGPVARPAEMPLPKVSRRVSGSAEPFRDRLDLERQLQGHGGIDQFREGPLVPGNVLGDSVRAS